METRVESSADVVSQEKDYEGSGNGDKYSRLATVYGCCQHLQQRYVFIILSMFGSAAHIMMSLSMSVAIVAMVKRGSSEDNSTVVLEGACPYDPEDNSSSSVSSSHGGEFDWDDMIQGYVLTASGFGCLLTGVLGARVAELWSPKMMYLITVVMGAVCNALLPAAARWDVAALITLRAIQGIFNGPIQATHSILLASWIPPDQRTRLGGLYYSAEAFGTILAMLLSGILITAVNWEFIFYLYAGIVAVWGVFWFFFVFDSPSEHPGISKEEKELIISSIAKETKVKYPAPWLKIVTSPPVWAHIAMQCGNIWTVYVLLSRFPTYLSNVLHFNISNAGIISALPMIITFCMCIVFAVVSSILKRRGILSQMGAYRVFNGISTLGPAATLIAVTQVGCDSTAIITLLIITCGLNAAFIGGSLYNLIDLAINFVGTTSGLLWTTVNITNIISPLIISAIINNNQTVYTWNTVFYISAGIPVLAYVIFLLFGSVEEQSWNKPVTEKDEKLPPADEEDADKLT